MSNLAPAMWPECRVPSGGQSDATETAQLVPRDAFLPHYREQRWQVSEVVQGACLQWSPRSVSRWREKKGIQDAQQRKRMPINALAPHLHAIQRWAMPQLHFRNQVLLLRTYVRYKFSWCQSGATTNCNHSAHFPPRSAATPICSNVTGRLQTFLLNF